VWSETGLGTGYKVLLNSRLNIWEYHNSLNKIIDQQIVHINTSQLVPLSYMIIVFLHLKT